MILPCLKLKVHNHFEGEQTIFFVRLKKMGNRPDSWSIKVPSMWFLSVSWSTNCPVKAEQKKSETDQKFPETRQFFFGRPKK